jgi:lysophospholipase L1-like esterase
VTILPGEEALSDPLEYDLPPLASVVVTISFGQTSDRVTGHPGSRATSYLQAGDAVSASSLPSAVETTHWYILTGIDVQAPASSAAVITLGDSITDGRGSTTDANDRWPDYLAVRLSTNATTSAVALVNQGIGGNAVVAGGLGPTAIARFERDVLQQPGARWLVLLEGVNDIGRSTNLGIATDLIAAYQQFITKAHVCGIRAYAIPVLPFGGSRYFSATHEAARQTVNYWIRTSGKFDAVIDVDAAVRDPQSPVNLLPRYDSGDHLHLNGAGYRRLADLIDLGLFTQ